MENATESTMEEILASIRKIISTDPKSGKPFSDNCAPKYSDEATKMSSKKADQETSPFLNDLSHTQHNQRIEPTFSSFAASSSNLSTPQSASPSSHTAHRLTAALDQELAGLFGMSNPPPKTPALEKDPTLEKWSTGYSYSKVSENSSPGFFPTYNSPSPVTKEHNHPSSLNARLSGAPSSSETLVPTHSPNLVSEVSPSRETFLMNSLNPNQEGVGALENLIREMGDPSLSPAVEKTLTPQIPPDFVLAPFNSTQAVEKLDEIQQETSKQLSEANASQHQDLSAPKESPKGEGDKPELFSTNSQISQRTIEDVVSDLLRPLLQQWVETHLPQLVPQLLKKDYS